MRNGKKPTPPKLARLLLNFFVRSGNRPYLIGDLEEDYENIVIERGKLFAFFWYWYQTIIPMPDFIKTHITWSLIMLKNYMKIGFRNLGKHKGFSFINITGLTIGMAICLLIAVLMMAELSYDRFHENSDRLYRVNGLKYDGNNTTSLNRLAAPVGPYLKTNYPEIFNALRFIYLGDLLFSHKNKLFYEGVLVADKSLFTMLSFPIIKGDAYNALSDPNSILLDETTAEKYFGNSDPIGKIITINNYYNFVVTGIFEDVPKNSSFQFKTVLPWEFMQNVDWFQENQWENQNFTTCIMLDKSSKKEDVESKIINVFNDHNETTRVDLSLQSFKDIHFGIEVNGPSTFFAFFFFAFLGFFILLISCINFMNLSTARASFRYKEIGVRKVIGGEKKDIILQFFSESLLLSFISFIFAVFIVQIVLNIFNNYTGLELSLDFTKNWILLFIMCGVLFSTGIMAGSYPALYLSSFLPINVLKGTHRFGKKSQTFRRILVTIQFATSIIFIISALIITKQADFIFNYDKGWNSQNILHIYMRGENRNFYDLLRDELLKNPNIQNITAGNSLPTNFFGNTNEIFWPGKDPQDNLYVRYNHVAPDYLETFKIKLAQGKSFSNEYENHMRSYIINESLAKSIGYDPIIGSEITLRNQPSKIIGIVKDFNFRTLKVGIQPMVMICDNQTSLNYMILKLNPKYTTTTLDFVHQTWEKIIPDHPIEYQFIDDDIYSMYNDEDILGKTMKIISLLAIFMTCSGLIGLIAFILENKKKELSIKKVLGASANVIIQTILREFLLLVAISNVIAWPIAYLMMKAMLNSYAFHTDMGIAAYFISGLFTIIIVLLTISYQTMKAAITNPVNALRHE